MKGKKTKKHNCFYLSINDIAIYFILFFEFHFYKTNNLSLMEAVVRKGRDIILAGFLPFFQLLRSLFHNITYDKDTMKQINKLTAVINYLKKRMNTTTDIDTKNVLEKEIDRLLSNLEEVIGEKVDIHNYLWKTSYFRPLFRWFLDDLTIIDIQILIVGVGAIICFLCVIVKFIYPILKTINKMLLQILRKTLLTIMHTLRRVPVKIKYIVYYCLSIMLYIIISKIPNRLISLFISFLPDYFMVHLTKIVTTRYIPFNKNDISFMIRTSVIFFISLISVFVYNSYVYSGIFAISLFSLIFLASCHILQRKIQLNKQSVGPWFIGIIGTKIISLTMSIRKINLFKIVSNELVLSSLRKIVMSLNVVNIASTIVPIFIALEMRRNVDKQIYIKTILGVFLTNVINMGISYFQNNSTIGILSTLGIALSALILFIGILDRNPLSISLKCICLSVGELLLMMIAKKLFL